MWNAFIGFMENILLQLSIFTGSMGFGIIIFTIITRLIILPLTLTSIRSSRKMQELQPKIKELQRKHGKDQKKLQEETVKLYQQERINPIGGCLPMLLQMPIFIGVYWAVLHLMDPAHREQLSPAVQAAIANDVSVQQILAKPFLFLDLGTKPFEEGFIHFNGMKYLILPIFSIVLQFTQQLMAMPRVQDPQQKAMSRAMLFMPLFFAYITLIFPAGAVLYWVTSSFVGIVQQYFTSGWGSLANHLTFLPADGKSSSQIPTTPTDVIQTTAVNAGNDDAPLTKSTSTSDTLTTSTTATGFWDVLRPLTESAGEENSPMTRTSTNSAKQTMQEKPRQDTEQQPGVTRRSRRRRS